MPLSMTSVASFSLRTLIICWVSGKRTDSYTNLASTWQAIIRRSFRRPSGQNTIGIKISESAKSPAMEDTIALNKNLRPFDTFFIRFLTAALTVEPAKKAASEATDALNSILKI